MQVSGGRISEKGWSVSAFGKFSLPPGGGAVSYGYGSDGPTATFSGTSGAMAGGGAKICTSEVVRPQSVSLFLQKAWGDMSYFFWALGVIVFIVDDDVFRLLGISPIAKFLIFFVLLAVGVIFNRQHLGRSFSAMINPRRALSQVFEHSDKFSKKSDSKTKNN